MFKISTSLECAFTEIMPWFMSCEIKNEIKKTADHTAVFWFNHRSEWKRIIKITLRINHIVINDTYDVKFTSPAARSTFGSTFDVDQSSAIFLSFAPMQMEGLCWSPILISRYPRWKYLSIKSSVYFLVKADNILPAHRRYSVPDLEKVPFR